MESKGIASIQSYVKKGQGLLWQNRSSCKLHYQTTLNQYEKVVRAKATKYEIPQKFFCFGDESTHVQKVVSGDNIFIIQPGNTFENFHDRVCFQDLIRDTCIPGKYTVPPKDANRGNLGTSVGLCSSQGTSRRLPDDPYAVPQFIDGTF